MYVISIKGIVNKETTFYYMTVNAESNKIELTDSLANAIQFRTVSESLTWAKERYTEILSFLLFYRGPKIINTSLAVRKIIFKTITPIDQSIFDEKHEEVNEDVSEEVNDALDESSNNDDLGNDGVEGSSDEDAGEASSSDL